MTTAPLVNGMFRGICVDNRDPRNLGRIRVQVPQILGVAASGWAFPAWSFHQKMIWPQDRLPKPGDGVWVMFDSTSPDKMIWMAAFGSLDLINQPDYVEMPDFKSILTMTMNGTPVWNEVCLFSGVLTSDLGGVPNPNPKVQLTGRNSGGDWRVLGTTVPDPDGSWSLGHLVELTGQVEYRAIFEGVGVYGPTSSETILAPTPAVTFPTTLTLTMTDPAPALNKAVPFSGVLSASTAPTGYTVPKGAVVTLLQRPAGGTWSTAASNIAVNETTGAWSTTHTITIPGSAEYQAVFTNSGIYLGSQSAIVPVNTSVGTTVSAPSLPTLVRGTALSVSGTVTVTSTGASVTEGTVNLWWRYTVGADQSWKQSSATATVVSGNYTLNHPALTILGATEWQVRYVGTSKFNAANSAAVAGTVGLPGQGVLTKGSVSHTSAAFSWAAVSGAVTYEVERWNGSAWIALATTSALSYTDSTLANDGQYYWRVRPKAADPAGTVVYGAYCSWISMTTGHPAVAPTTGSQTFSFTSTTFRCYRNDTGWQGSGDYEMRQSWFSSAYGGQGYVGIARYSGIRAAIVAAAGENGLANGSCTSAKITLYRTATGTDTNATASFYTTASTGSGGRPTLLGSAVNIAASGYSASKTYDIGTAHGARLAKEEAFSVAIARDSSGHYLGLNGAGTNGGKLEIGWTWSYGGVSLVSPTWV